MTLITLPNTLTPGTTENVTHVQENDAAIVTVVNGNLDSTNLTTATNQYLGLSDSLVRRGKSIIATEEVRTNTAYGTLTTPDQVSSVVLPTDALIVVVYQASYKESVPGAATAALFLGANQTKVPQKGQAAPVTVAAHINVSNTYVPLQTFYGGLCSAPSSTAYTGDVTTGQALGAVGTGMAAQFGGVNTIFDNAGGPCILMAAAGTYTVSVQFKAVSGTVTAKDRKLWVWTMAL